MKLFKRILIALASLALLVGCGGSNSPKGNKKHSVIYKVNGTTDLSRINADSSILPSEGKEGERVSIHVAASSGYDYLAFMPSVPEDYEEEQAFYDQFIDYTLREDTFFFNMPKCDVTINFNIQEHTERYNVTFDTVSHATFDFQGSDEPPFAEGEKVHFVISVDADYELVGYPFIVGDESIEISKTITDVYSFDMPAKAVTISATVRQRVVTTYSCTLDTVEHVTMRKHPSIPSLDTLEENDPVIIVITPEEGYEVDGMPFIVGDSSVVVTAAFGVTNGYRFVMPAKDVTFSCYVKSTSEEKYTVSFASVSHASFAFSGTSESEYAAGRLVIFNITIDDGYRLEGDSFPFAVGDSTVEISKYSSTGTSFSFTMPARAVVISANIVAKAKYSVTIVESDHITFTKDSSVADLGSIEEGAQVTIIVTCDSGYELDGLPFIVDESDIEVHKSIKVDNGYYFTMPSKNVSFSATAKESTITKYSVTFATVANVTFQKHSGSENPCAPGESFMFTAICVDGVSLVGTPYDSTDASLEVKAHSVPSTYFFEMPEHDVVITATTSGTPKVLDHLSLGTKKTEYQVNEEFVKPQVYAHYSNMDVEEVPAASLVCTGYDMATAGEYTVTVKYTKSGVTASTTYSITVSGKTPSPSVSLEHPYVLNYSKNITFKVTFNADNTGYYEKIWVTTNEGGTQTTTVYKVNFKFEVVTENVWRIYEPQYETGTGYDSFNNGYRMFAHQDFSDYQETLFRSYTNSIEVKLYYCTSGGIDQSKTAFRSFALSAE